MSVRSENATNQLVVDHKTTHISLNYCFPRPRRVNNVNETAHTSRLLEHSRAPQTPPTPPTSPQQRWCSMHQRSICWHRKRYNSSFSETQAELSSMYSGHGLHIHPAPTARSYTLIMSEGIRTMSTTPSNPLQVGEPSYNGYNSQSYRVTESGGIGIRGHGERGSCHHVVGVGAWERRWSCVNV